MEKYGRFVRKLAYLLIIVFLSGCGTDQTRPTPSASLTFTPTPAPTPTPTASPTSTPTSIPTPTLTPIAHFDIEEISFTTEDDLKISGYIYRGGGDMAVILALQRSRSKPGAPQTQKSWQYFSELLASKGYTVLTFNFRGIGRSEGDIDDMENEVVKDTQAAIEFLQGEGYERIACVGAEMGGTSCMEAAQSHELEGLVVIASTLSLGEPTKITD